MRYEDKDNGIYGDDDSDTDYGYENDEDKHYSSASVILAIS